MVKTIRGLKSKQSQQLGQQIKQTSNARVRSEIDFLTLQNLEKNQSRELGKVILRNLKGKNVDKLRTISSVDKEIMLAFKGKENNLQKLLSSSKLSKNEKVVLVSYASTYISRLLDKAVRNKFGSFKRKSKSIELSNVQINDLTRLLSGISGLQSSQIRNLLNQRISSAKSLNTQDHFQISTISVLSKYVFSSKPQLSANEFISHFLSTLKKSESYSDFYDSLNDPNQPSNKKLFRLLGMTGYNPSKALIYSKKLKPATVIHELVHDILSISGKKELYWSEPFVTMVSNIVAERSGFNLGYLDSRLRKNFAKSPGYAISNFPWRGITEKDIGTLANSIERVISKDSRLSNARYSEFNKLLVPVISPLLFNVFGELKSPHL
jgi:DNA-directed RNA polymerase subunit L